MERKKKEKKSETDTHPQYRIGWSKDIGTCNDRIVTRKGFSNKRVVNIIHSATFCLECIEVCQTAYLQHTTNCKYFCRFALPKEI